MPAITLAQAQARLADWLAADEAVSKGQSYSVAGRSVSRADAEQIRENISYWQGQVNRIEANSRGGNRVRYGVSGG